MPLDSNRAIDQAEYDALWDEADAGGGNVRYVDEIERRETIPKQLGQGETRIIELQPGLEIYIETIWHRRSLRLDYHMANERMLSSVYYLAGECRHINPSIRMESDRREKAGESCLGYFRDNRMIEYVPAEKTIQKLAIDITLQRLRSFGFEDEPVSALLKPLLHPNQAPESFHQSLNSVSPVAQQILQQILACPYRGSIKRMYLESKAIELLALQFHQLTETQKTAQSPLKMSHSDIESLERARDILQKKFADPPSLLTLAKQVELNDFKLKKGFRHLFGTTAFGYIRRCRMEQAQQLLKESELSVAAIAAQVGYASPSQFCYAFKRHVGMTPSQYRQ